MSPSRLFPIFLKLHGENCIVIGGGPVALAKTESLLKAGAMVEVVAPELCEGLRAKVSEAKVTWRGERFNPGHLETARLVIAATDDSEVNRLVAASARERGLPVNVADTPALCTFYMPAVLDRFPLQIAISSSGASPLLARILRARLQMLLPHWYSEAAARLGEIRAAIKGSELNVKSRRHFWELLLESATPDFSDETIRARLNACVDSGGKRQGIVHLIGAGPGDPELLTLKAVRLLQNADAIVHDRLVSEEILSFARKEAERIYVGKARGTHSTPQEEINSLLVSLARQGKTVVRLKGGDPFIFGRGGEECEALIRAKIPYSIVPGITAALGCAAATGIPLTHREVAHSLLIVTGRHADELAKFDWSAANRPGQTTVIYMGLCGLRGLRDNLLESGMSPSMPAALIQDGTTPRQKTVICTVNDLPESAEAARLSPPVLVIVGEVVRKVSSVEAIIGISSSRDATGPARAAVRTNHALSAY